jgi:uncharacterized protein YpmS
LENLKKKKYKKLAIWLIIDLTVAIIIFTLLLYKPSQYKASTPDQAEERQGKVYNYLTYLSSELYNGAQLAEPFELTIIDQKVNEAIAQWSAESEDIRFQAPAILFKPAVSVLMGTAEIKGIQFVVTIELEPVIDQQGLLNLKVDRVKVGAMNITPLAKLIAKKMYTDRLTTMAVDTDDVRSKIAASLLVNEPFDPVFLIEDKKIRIKQLTIEAGKLIVYFSPAF